MVPSWIQFLEETAQGFPNKIAVSCNSKSLTFKELTTSSKNLSTQLPSDIKNCPIAILLPKSCDSIVAFMAVLYSGNFYSPLDVKLPEQKIKKILANLEPRAIITNSDLTSFIKREFPKCTIIAIDQQECIAAVPNEPTGWKKILDKDPIYCIYTSGSTGEPKGVLISHQGVMDYILWAAQTYPIDQNTQIANQAPFHFDNSTLDIYLMIFLGAELHLVPESYFSFPARLLDFLEQKKISFIFWVPSVLINIANLNILKNRSLPDLVLILFAGEVMPTKCLNHWRSFIQHAIFSNLYGPTEITVDCTYFIVNRNFTDQESLPIGLPCRNSEIILLGDQNQEVREGGIGEIYVRGSGLAMGYWKLPKKTSESFIQNPLHNNYPDLVYRTGDLAKYNDYNELVFIGRKDSQIKHLGHRIELGEIETACSSISEISNCCILYENQKIVCIYECSESQINENKIKEYLTELLPKYMHPQTFIYVATMPLNRNGKIDRLELKNTLINNTNEL